MTLIDTDTAALAAGVTPATIRQWVTRGKLHPAATRPHRYRITDLTAIRDKRRLDSGA